MVSRIVPALLIILLQSLLDHGLAYEVVHVRDGGAIAGRVAFHAFEHPYFAVSDADGRFEITHVPPGRYTLTAWHEGWRILEYDQEGRPRYEGPSVMTAEVTVNPGATAEVEFQLRSP